LLNRVRELIKLHNTEPALLAYAEFVPIYAEKDKYPFAYIRGNGKDRLLIVVNPAKREVSGSFILNYKCQKPKLISGKGTILIEENKTSITLEPVSYAIFRINEVR
jgi:glycosidase